MGYVFDFKDAIAYEQWLNKPANKATFDLETQLMHTLLQPMRGESILDIGCGTGACLKFLLDKELLVTGLDPSTYMLDIASRKVGSRVDLYRGYAEDLPFDDNSFNYSCPFILKSTLGWLRCFTIIGKFIVTMLALMALVSTTRFNNLLTGLQRLGFPSLLVIQLGFLYRYIFVLIDRAHHILRARAGRRLRS